MKKLGGISTAAAKKATGHDWSQWITILDGAGAAQWDHKQIVAYLHRNHDLSPWWQQMVTVAYEKAKGRRVVGQTAASGFQVGVQKTLPIAQDEAWKLLTSRRGIACWLGKVRRFSFEPGHRYTTDQEIRGEIRVVKPEQRVRLTWQQPGMKRPATLQITLAASGPRKTSLRVHLEKLPSKKSRAEMKTYWGAILERLAEMATG